MNRRVPTLERHDFNQLRELIEDWCGIALEDNKLYLVETRLRDLVMELGCDTYAEFFRKAQRADRDLRDRIVDDMTTNETSWFRDELFWDMLRTHLIPAVAERAAQDNQTTVRVWSAACSTGQEPYSIAILLNEMQRSGELHGLAADSFRIVASDISRSALQIAKSARYDPISMRRGMQPALRDRYFALDGRVHVLREEVRKNVQFRRMNLLDPLSHLGLFDMVLLRNVLIYFSSDCKRRIVDKVSSMLVPEGALAVGATESPEVYTQALDTVRAGRCTYYRAKERS